MKTKLIIVATACCLTAAWTIAQQHKANTNDVKSAVETQVSESRKNGKYKRTTETFTGKLLVARKEEVSVKDNGRTDYVFVKLYRDGEMIFASTQHCAENRTIRSYYHQGKVIVEEGDEDGDGSFETMILFGTNEQPVEAFSKRKDGTVARFEKEKLAELKRAFGSF